MTPGILVVSVEATETPLEMEEVGMATVIDMPTDPDETKITDRESDITRANNTMIRDQSGGIEHHIPIEVCRWVSLFNSSDFCLVPSSSRVRRYCITIDNYQKHQPWRCGVLSITFQFVCWRLLRMSSVIPHTRPSSPNSTPRHHRWFAHQHENMFNWAGELLVWSHYFHIYLAKVGAVF